MIVGRALVARLPAARDDAAARSDPRCSAAERIVDRGQAQATPRSACAPAKSSASPACRAWGSSICFSPVSAWPT